MKNMYIHILLALANMASADFLAVRVWRYKKKGTSCLENEVETQRRVAF
jgi:hypothetical protein